MKRLVKILTILAVVAAVAAVLRRRPVPPRPTPAARPAPARPATSPTPEPVPATASAPGPTWVEPTADGGCPESHPVKAKLSSQIFHVPGGALYERTVPDRCYPSPAAAEADGLRASKR